jgi:hypothetical protein
MAHSVCFQRHLLRLTAIHGAAAFDTEWLSEPDTAWASKPKG